MLPSYDDLYELTDKPPLWWDQNGTPRWKPFSPGAMDIYADEALLMEVFCQQCRKSYMVGMCSFSLDAGVSNYLLSQVRNGAIHYGDPPNTDCCSAGAAMNSVPIRVIEFFSRIGGEWVRRIELERRLPETEW